jgi:MoaA/NifB/PqqE/SkfB family radical SAM enzyme
MNHASKALQETIGKLVARAYLARVRADGRPFAVGHFITNRCNCKCPSCLWRHNDWEDVPLDVLQRFYTAARAEGFLAAAFTGGEPFLRKDLGQIVRFVKGQGMAVLVFTTGWFLEKRMDEVLPHIDALMISLDSSRPERHDEIRGLAGLFDRVVRGVQLVRSRYPDLSLQLNCCVQRGIADEIDDLVALARDLDVNISFDVITEHRNGADGSAFTATDVGLPLPELREVCGGLPQRKQAGAPIVNSEHYFKYFIAGRPGYRCHLPKLVMMVDGRGYVEDCLDLDHPIANIRTTPLAEIMALPRFKALRADAEGCSTCSSPTMVDMSCVWEDPRLMLEPGGVTLR